MGRGVDGVGDIVEVLVIVPGAYQALTAPTLAVVDLVPTDQELVFTGVHLTIAASRAFDIGHRSSSNVQLVTCGSNAA
jgi:hypothetical protein